MFEVVKVGDNQTVASPNATNHVYVVDVSGSMNRSLPAMRTHLKNIVAMITTPEDTFSIIYFSGRGQCGVVVENVPVADIGSVTAIQKTIDRWLAPIGLTGFHEPMELALDLAGRLEPSKNNNFVMLTDGYDNQSKVPNILEAAKNLPSKYDSVAFIEFGWFCDRNLIKSMAEMSGGVHLFADGYDEYERRFESSIQDAIRVPKIDVAVNKKAKSAMYIHEDNIIIADVGDNHSVSVPETVDYVYAIVPKDVLQKQMSADRLYMVLYYALKKDDARLAWRALEALGDVRLIDEYSNAFTRQEVSAVESLVHECIFNENARFVDGKDLNYLPPEDATTLMDVVGVLAAAEDVKLCVNSPLFKYNRTSKASKQAEELPMFVPNPEEAAKVTGVVTHSSRANVSIQTIINGSVKLPENEWNLNFIPSHITRNYTVIKDGIRNIDDLPLLVSDETYHRLAEILEPHQMSVISATQVVVHLSKLPVINRVMSRSVDLDKFKHLVEDLTVYQGIVKGLKASIPTDQRKTEGMKEKYGEDAATWLSSIGVRDYGFSPKSKSVESTDSYPATEVVYKIKGLSSLPSVKDVQKKLDADKPLTLREKLVYNGLSAKSDDMKQSLEAFQAEVRTTQTELSKMTYAIIIGKTWFDGVSDETVDTKLDVLGESVPLTITMKKTDIPL